MAEHRKQIKHFHDPGHCHELTFSCYRSMPLLTNDSWRAILSQHIDRATSKHGFQLVAFVYMPTHVHLLVEPSNSDGRIDQLLSGIKRPFSVRVKRLLEGAPGGLLRRLTVLERPGKTVFRFWQVGPGYDRNITNPGTIQAAIQYIHLNPVRAGLVTRAVDWRWSSTRHYYGRAEEPDPVLPTICGPSPEALDDMRT